MIEGFYNRVRSHKHLDQLSPHEFERQRQTALSKVSSELGEYHFYRGQRRKERDQTFRISLTNPNDPIVNPTSTQSLISSWISLRRNMGKAHGGS
jgi:hypothetical protein